MAEEQAGVTLTPDQVTPPAMPDDGLDDAERQIFQDMQQGKGVEVPDTTVEPAAGEDPPATTEVKAGETPPAEDDDGEDDEPKVDPKTGKPDHRRRVNYIRFKKVEDRLAASEAEKAQLRETVARFDERMKIVNDALATQAPDPTAQQQALEDQDPMPDMETDLFGFMKWQQRDLDRKLDRLAGAITGTQQHITSEADHQAYLSDYMQSVQRYAASEPLIPIAYQFLVQSRGKELELSGVADKAQRDKILQEEERGLYNVAKKQGRDPAETIWRMAVQRGFNKQNPVALWGLEWDPATMSVKPPATNGAAAATNGAAVAPRPAAAPAAVAAGAPSVQSVIAGVKNGQSSALSLSNGGGVPAPVLTPQMLADMPQAEFDAMLERLTPKQQRELLGT